MEDYKLYNDVPKVVKFLEELTMWYVKLNRPRLKGDKGPEENLITLNVLFNVIFKKYI
jgi:isoleucyl-tRNA synthetase